MQAFVIVLKVIAGFTKVAGRTCCDPQLVQEASSPLFDLLPLDRRSSVPRVKNLGYVCDVGKEGMHGKENALLVFAPVVGIWLASKCYMRRNELLVFADGIQNLAVCHVREVALDTQFSNELTYQRVIHRVSCLYSEGGKHARTTGGEKRAQRIVSSLAPLKSLMRNHRSFSESLAGIATPKPSLSGHRTTRAPA